MRKNYTKQLFVVIVTLLCSVAASAYDFEVDGIYYNILSEEEKTVEVVAYSDWSNYSGNIEIPETVHQTWLGPEYTVVAIGNNAFQYCQLDNITLPNFRNPETMTLLVSLFTGF